MEKSSVCELRISESTESEWQLTMKGRVSSRLHAGQNAENVVRDFDISLTTARRWQRELL